MVELANTLVNLNQNAKFSFLENAYENIEMAVILYKGRWVNLSISWYLHYARLITAVTNICWNLLSRVIFLRHLHNFLYDFFGSQWTYVYRNIWFSKCTRILDNGPLIFHNKQCGFWWSGDGRRQCSNTNGGLVFMGNSSFIIRRIKSYVLIK